MKKIAIVCPTDFLGGAELFVVDFCKFVVRQFSNVARWPEVCVIFSSNQTGSKFAALLPGSCERRTMDFPRLKKFSPLSILRFWRTARKLRKVLGHIGPSVVLANSVRAALLAGFAMRKEKTPVDFFGHDFTFPGFFLRRVHNFFRRIFTCSQAVAHDLLRKCPRICKKRIAVVPSAVEVAKGPICKRQHPGKIHVGILGRLDWWKGQDIFLQAGRIALEKFPGQFEFFIFGESSPHDLKTVQFAKSLQDTLKGFPAKVQRHFHLPGFVPGGQAFAKLDICVHASTAPEPLGRVILEAFSRGIPVIASAAGGAREIVQDGENGFLLEPGNAQALAEKILKLAFDGQLQEKFSRAGLRTVREKFDVQKVFTSFLHQLLQVQLENSK